MDLGSKNNVMQTVLLQFEIKLVLEEQIKPTKSLKLHTMQIKLDITPEIYGSALRVYFPFFLA